MTDIICDLVLLSWNHLEQTKPCLKSLFRETQVSCRLIIVDNGSTQKVREFLRSVKPHCSIREVLLIQNDTNLGFVEGMNAGMRTCRAPFVCLLNNDLLFTRGWLKEMLFVAHTYPQAGVINPQSNTFGNRPAKGISIEAHARNLPQGRSRVSEAGMCIGFCMLIKQEVIRKIGYLSEQVDTIFFEDEDFCMRAQQAGFLCLVAEWAYVYHAEHQSVGHMSERERLFEKNKRWCEKKWGKRIRIAWPNFDRLETGCEPLKSYLSRMVALARSRSHVYAIAPFPQRSSYETLFESIGLIPHSDVHIKRIPRPCASITSTAFVISRRRKPFDVIVAPDERWRRAMLRLRWLHGAEVVSQHDEERLREACRLRSSLQDQDTSF